jgi:hypothetical protein
MMREDCELGAELVAGTEVGEGDTLTGGGTVRTTPRPS